MSWTQTDENDDAQTILVCPPNITNSIGTYHPSGFLYESHVSFSDALSEHEGLRKFLKDNGYQVFSVLDVLRMNCDEDPEARASLEKFAAKCLNYQLLDGDESSLSSQYLEQFSEEYKLKSLKKMSLDQLVDIVLTNPALAIKKAPLNTFFECRSVIMSPLANLTSSRDSLIVTAKGVVISSMAALNRRPETEVIKFCLSKLGIPTLGQVNPPGCLEGGDFFPAGRPLCFLGVGIRTNSHGLKQLLANDWLGTDRVAVVKDYFDRKQERMHIDTMLNFISSNVVFLHEGAVENSPTCRYVDEYRKTEQNQYVLVEHDIPFPTYLKSEGYEIVFFGDCVQANYGPNFLRLDSRKLVCIDNEAANIITPHFPGNITVLPYRNVADMNGGAHCTTQVLRRRAMPRLLELENAAVIACCAGNVSEVALYLKEGIKVNDTFYSGYALLHLAVIFGHLPLIQTLLDTNARIDLCTSSLFSPLDLALLVSSSQRDSSVISCLTRRGARTRRFSFSPPPSLSPSVSKQIAQLHDNFSHSLLTSMLASIVLSAPDIPLGWICSRTPLDQPCQFSQSPRRLLMVVPATFDPDTKNACQSSPTLPVISREVADDVQQTHSLIVHTLSDCGVEIYLDISDEFEQAPYAFLIGSYFSTHLTSCSSRFAFLHPITDFHSAIHNPFYKRIIAFLQDKYQKLIFPSNTLSASVTAPPQNMPLTASVLNPSRFIALFDRANHVAYSSSLDPQLPSTLRQLGYIHAYIPSLSFPSSESMDINSFMLVGTHVLLLCQDWFSELHSKCSNGTLKLLQATQSNKTVIRFTLEQAMRGAIFNSIEFLGEKNQPILLTSNSCSNVWTEQQLQTLAQTCTKHVSIDLDCIEQFTRGSIQALFAPLF